MGFKTGIQSDSGSPEQQAGEETKPPALPAWRSRRGAGCHPSPLPGHSRTAQTFPISPQISPSRFLPAGRRGPQAQAWKKRERKEFRRNFAASAAAGEDFTRLRAASVSAADSAQHRRWILTHFSLSEGLFFPQKKRSCSPSAPVSRVNGARFRVSDREAAATRVFRVFWGRRGGKPGWRRGRPEERRAES